MKAKIVKIVLTKHQNKQVSQYEITQLVNAVYVKVEGYSWSVGEYIAGKTAQQLCDVSEYEVTINLAKQPPGC